MHWFGYCRSDNANTLRCRDDGLDARCMQLKSRVQTNLLLTMKRSFWPGVLGGIAIIPYGLAMLFWWHAHINVYGTKTLQLLTPKPSPWLAFIQHMLISYLFAVPLLWALAQMRLQSRPRAFPLFFGAAYGFLIWSSINALLLPYLFHDPTPWQLGWHAVWPSLLGHVLYGLVAAGIGKRVLSSSRANLSGK